MAILPKNEGAIIGPAKTSTVEADLTRLVTDLFEQHQTAVYNYVYRLTNDPEWANDLTQEAFLQLYRKRRQLLDVKNHRAWVYRIASNLTFNAIKRRNRFRWLPWREETDSQLQTADSTTRLDQQEQVQQTLNKIEPKYRAPLVLFGQYGLSIKEIAEVLDISENNVKVRLHRARKMFRVTYGDLPNG